MQNKDITEKPKTERIILILLHLIRNRTRKFTAGDIHRWINSDEPVSLRNVQRDLKKLAETRGTCVISHRTGQKVQYYIEPDMRDKLDVPIEKNSILALFFLKRLQPFFAPGAKTLLDISETLQELGNEIDDVLFEDLDTKLEDTVQILGQRSMLALDNELLDKLLQAVFKRKHLIIDYRRSDTEPAKNHEICPVKFFMSNNDLYIAAVYPTDKTKHFYFKICRIVSATSSDTSFTLNELQLKKVNDHLHQSFGIFDKEGSKPQVVKLMFPGWFSTILKEKRFHPSQKITIDKKGNAICSFTVPIEEELTRWILGWADLVTVISPTSIKKNIQVIFKGFSERNGK